MDDLMQQVTNLSLNHELDQLTDEDAIKHIDAVKCIREQLQAIIDSTPDGWTKLCTKNGATQNTELLTKNITRKALGTLGLSYTEASSQKPYDFRHVGKEQGINLLWIEIKKNRHFNRNVK